MIDENAESYATSHAVGLGGTDVAALVGLSPWKRPIDIYAGKVDPQSMPELDKECLAWGTALEPLIRDRYALRFGVDVVAPADIPALYPRSKPWNGQTIIIGDQPWMFGTPDGLLPKHQAGLEVKCSAFQSAEWGAEGTDEIPPHYLIQATWYMAVTRLKAWNFAVLFSGNRLVPYRVERNDDLVKELVSTASAFWHDHVLKQVPPPIDASENYGRYLARKFSLATLDLIPPTAEITEWAQTLKDASEECDAAEAKKQLAKNQLAALIGDAQGSKTILGKIGWVRQKNASYSVDYKAAFEEAAKLASLDVPTFLEPHTKERTVSPYIRAWFTKVKEVAHV